MYFVLCSECTHFVNIDLSRRTIIRPVFSLTVLKSESKHKVHPNIKTGKVEKWLSECLAVIFWKTWMKVGRQAMSFYTGLPYLKVMNGFVTRVTIRVPHVEQELLILPKHLYSLPVLVRFVLIDILFSVWCYIDHCLSFPFLPDTTLCDKVCQWLATGCGFLRVLRFPPPIKLTATI